MQKQYPNHRISSRIIEVFSISMKNITNHFAFCGEQLLSILIVRVELYRSICTYIVYALFKNIIKKRQMPIY